MTRIARLLGGGLLSILAGDMETALREPERFPQVISPVELRLKRFLAILRTFVDKKSEQKMGLDGD